MHYDNDVIYNADFDGDEMNIHFVGDNRWIAELKELTFVDKQYRRPSSWDYLRGLIQDYILACVLMTHKGTFFHQREMMYILYCVLGMIGGLQNDEFVLVERTILPQVHYRL